MGNSQKYKDSNPKKIWTPNPLATWGWILGFLGLATTARVEQVILDYLDLVHFDVLVPSWLAKSELVMFCFFPLFKNLISKNFILSCFNQFVCKSWYSLPDTVNMCNVTFYRDFSNQRKIHWVKWELHPLFWHIKQRFVEWVKKSHFPHSFFLDFWYFDIFMHRS